MSDYRDKNDEILQRGVAQSGSAPGLGPGGRRFESCRPDKQKRLFLFRRAFFAYCMLLYLFHGSYNIVVFLTICISYANNCFTL